MLAARDQWGDLVPLQRSELTDEELEKNVRPRLNRALELVVCSGLTELAERVPAGLLERLSELASELGDRPSSTESPSPIAVCRDRRIPPGAAADHLEHWRALIHLIVSPSQGSWRKGFNRNHIGFETSAADKARLKEFTSELADRTDLLEALCAVGDLPPAIYPTNSGGWPGQSSASSAEPLRSWSWSSPRPGSVTSFGQLCWRAQPFGNKTAQRTSRPPSVSSCVTFSSTRCRTPRPINTS